MVCKFINILLPKIINFYFYFLLISERGGVIEREIKTTVMRENY